MLDFEIYTDKIAESGRRLIRRAYDEARNRDHNQIAPEHILVSIAEGERPFFNEVMQSLNLNPQVVLQALETKLGQREYIGRGIKMSESFRTMLANALKNARLHHRRLIGINDCFIALFQDEESFPCKFFRQLGIDSATVIQRIRGCEHLIDLHKRPQNRPPKDEGDGRSPILDLEIYTDTIAASGRRVIRKAYEQARARNSMQIGTEHIFLAIAEIDVSLCVQVMHSLHLDPKVISESVEEYLYQQTDNEREFALRMAVSFRTLLADALKNAHANHRRSTELADLFIALFQNEENYIVKLFQQFGVDRKMAIQEIQSHSGNLNRG